jgi:cytosine/creatinine deaminase
LPSRGEGEIADQAGLFNLQRFRNGAMQPYTGGADAIGIEEGCMDLIVSNVRLADRPGTEPVDIGVVNGWIAAIGRGLGEAGESYDAGGRLACAGLIETHIHLDKSRLIDRLPAEPGRRINPMRRVAEIKKDLTVEDIRRRAALTLEDCIANGATSMRTQV